MSGRIVASRRELLRAGMDVALDHRAEDAAAAATDLARELAYHVDLPLVLPAGAQGPEPAPGPAGRPPLNPFERGPEITEVR